MKVAITSCGEYLSSEIDTRFGRCGYFLKVDTETLVYESIPNRSAMASGGAGIQAAQTVSELGVEAVITGDVGPNAFRTLNAAGIKIITGASGTVKEAIEKFQSGELKETGAPTSASHAGMGGGRGLGGVRGQ
jgi:predicted Fe-Mo cluster-binding NifX family protein